MGKRAVAGLLLLVAFVTITTFMYLNVSTVAAAGDPVPDCDPVAKAGEMVVYRCEDLDMDIVCYSQGLMLFCLQN